MKGFIACEYEKWIDNEWEGRAKDVIRDVAKKNNKLEKRINEIEIEIQIGG